ncbi:hypothetical protein HY214_04450 [Candidatus Roizmanbacteria bacterium]|nr:hypothetical protein [Candidatus Roizmanbacteria bacterium]
MKAAEFVQFRTADGLTLPGLLFAPAGGTKVAIYLHGNGSSSVFYKENYELAHKLNEGGVAVLFFNNRGAHLIKKLDVWKNGRTERKFFGMAYEKIKDCVIDIEAAVAFLKARGYGEFYLIGVSTGANKICVYDHYRPKNAVKKYVSVCGGDDTGIYYQLFGKEKFNTLLRKAEEKVEKGLGEELIGELMPADFFSYRAFYDTADPNGDYNVFPFYEVINKVKLSRKPLFRYFKAIKKPTLVVYGALDEYAWGDVPRAVAILKRYQPGFEYAIVPGADHGFTGKDTKLARTVSSYIINSRV